MKGKLGKIGMAFLALTLCLAVVGAGFAYFSDTETSLGNTFTAGTLNMQIADSDEGWNDGSPVHASWTSPAGWAPGETITTGVISLRNVGSMDINYLFTTFYNYTYTGASLADVIQVVEYWEYIPGYDWIQNIGGTQQLETLVGDKSAPLTLKELIDAYWSGDTSWMDYCTGSGYDQTPGPAIIVGGTYQALLKLKFSETAGDAYQGATCSFDIQFYAAQDTSQNH